MKYAVDRDCVLSNIASIEVQKNQLVVRLKPASLDGDQEAERARKNETPVILVPWCKPPTRKAREILLPASVPRLNARPMKAERRAALIKSIARGRAWLDELVSGRANGVDEIAARYKCGVRHVNLTISMAFIAPALVKAAIEGRLPRGIGVASLRDAPAEWSQQLERLGLAQSA